MQRRTAVEVTVKEARDYLTNHLTEFYKNHTDVLKELVGRIGIKPVDRMSDEDVMLQFAELCLAEKVIKDLSMPDDTLVLIRKADDFKNDKAFDLVDVSTQAG